jgi:hypothetical protein
MYLAAFLKNLISLRSKKFPMISTVAQTNGFFCKNWAPVLTLANVPFLAVLVKNNLAIDAEADRVCDSIAKNNPNGKEAPLTD